MTPIFSLQGAVGSVAVCVFNSSISLDGPKAYLYLSMFVCSSAGYVSLCYSRKDATFKSKGGVKPFHPLKEHNESKSSIFGQSQFLIQANVLPKTL